MAFKDWGAWLGGGIPGAFGSTKFGKDFLFGTKDKFKKLPTMNPQQEQLLSQLLGQLNGGSSGQAQGNAMGLLQDYLNPQSEIYKNFEKPYLQEFEQQTIPGLAEQFAGFGGGMGGGLSSSGFGQALGAAGANLQTNLAQMKSNMQRQSIQDILGQYNTMTSQALGQQPFAYTQQPGSTGVLAQLLQSIIQNAPKAFMGG